MNESINKYIKGLYRYGTKMSCSRQAQLYSRHCPGTTCPWPPCLRVQAMAPQARAEAGVPLSCLRRLCHRFCRSAALAEHGILHGTNCRNLSQCALSGAVHAGRSWLSKYDQLGSVQALLTIWCCASGVLSIRYRQDILVYQRTP